MNKKNTLLLTIIAVATLLVAVIGATFAYFNATATAGTHKVQVTTPKAQTALISGTNTVSLSITGAQMENQGQIKEYSKTASPKVSLTASQTGQRFCYKAQLSYDGSGFSYPSGHNDRQVSVEVKKGNKEYSVDITNKSLAEGSSYLKEEGNSLAIGSSSDIHILKASTNLSPVDQWNIKVSFWNYPTYSQNPGHINENKTVTAALKLSPADCPAA